MWRIVCNWIRGIASYLFLLLLCCVVIYTTVSTYLVEEKLSPQEEQNNMAGICSQTGTNLLDTLGRQKFYELILQNYISANVQYMNEYVQKHHEICAQMNCGFFYLSPDNQSFEQFLDKFRKKFFETAVYNPATSRMENDPIRVLTKEMALDKLYFPVEEISTKGGFFYKQNFSDGWIIHFFKDATNNFFTIDEMESLEYGNKYRGMKRNLDRLKKGYGNFYIRVQQALISLGLSDDSIDQLQLFDNDDFIGVSNCGLVK